MDLTRRIVVTGPESTGKSKLAEELAAALKLPLVQEFAREYLNQLNRPYHENDLRTIALGQLKAEQRLANEPRIICDTDLLVMEVWWQWKYRRKPADFEHLMAQQGNGFYLLCNIDLPWEEDPLREHPNFRKELFDLHQYNLEHRHLPYGVVQGTGKERLQNALDLLEKRGYLK